MNEFGWKTIAVRIAFFCGFVSAFSQAIAATKPAAIRLRIAYAAPIGVMAPLWMAAETGALKGGAAVKSIVVVGCPFGELLGYFVCANGFDETAALHTARKRDDGFFEVKTGGDFG